MDADIAHAVAEWGRADRQYPRWRGRCCQQFPADLWRYAELCAALRPAFVVEVGVADGGTALFLADICEALDLGHVFGIDIAVPQPPDGFSHPRLSFVQGDAADGLTLTGPGRGLVLLDGDHRAVQVAQELEVYAPLADYLVVEDTLMRWLPGYDDGPHRALDAWLPGHPEFLLDPDPVPGPTQHPGGWLRRVGI